MKPANISWGAVIASDTSVPPRQFLLTLVSDRRSLGQRKLATLAREAACSGIDRIQVREKDLPDRALLDLLVGVMEATSGTTAQVLVSSRPDVASVVGAHGVQLPEEGLPVGEVKRAFPQLLLGVSCHSLEAALRAEASGADFVLLGPIFPTPGKTRPLGLGVLAEVAGRLTIPVHAIGGIDVGRASAVQVVGAHGMAGIRVFLKQPLGPVVEGLRQVSGDLYRSSASPRSASDEKVLSLPEGGPAPNRPGRS